MTIKYKPCLAALPILMGLICSGTVAHAQIQDSFGSNGILAYGTYAFGESTPSKAPFDRVIAKGNNAIVFRRDGSFLIFGDGSTGQCALPARIKENPLGTTDDKQVAYSPASVVLSGYHVMYANGRKSAVWGDNTYGQLDLLNRPWVSLSGGLNFTIGLDTAGFVSAMGNNDDGQTKVPTGLANVVKIRTGDLFALAEDKSGKVWVWGNNTDKQKEVPAGLKKPRLIQCGGSTIAAVGDDNKLYVWGNVAEGQGKIPAGLLGANITKIAVGSKHILALDTKGKVWAWGDNSFGQLTVPTLPVTDIAAGFLTSYFLYKDSALGNLKYLASGNNSFGQRDLPKASVRGKFIAATSIGLGFTVAKLSDGTLTAWGDNQYGQCELPPQVKGKRVDQFAAGSEFAAARIGSNVYAWGRNDAGQLNVPAKLSATMIAVGSAHVLAFDAATQKVVAWGLNDDGQCMVPSTLATDIVALAAGEGHSLALTKSGKIFGWGRDDDGQTTAPSVYSGTYTGIVAGANHSLATTSYFAGFINAIGFGANEYGQSPKFAVASSDNVGIAAGETHSVFRSDSKISKQTRVDGLGSNYEGQIAFPGTNPQVKSVEGGEIFGMAAGYSTTHLLPGYAMAVKDWSTMVDGKGEAVIYRLPNTPRGNVTFKLSSSLNQLQVPDSVDIKGNEDSVAFGFYILRDSDPGTCLISAATSKIKLTAIVPVFPKEPVARGLSLSAKSVIGGTPVTAYLTMSGKFADDTTVDIESSDPNVVVPSVVVLPKGADTVKFTVVTKATASPVEATIDARAGANVFSYGTVKLQLTASDVKSLTFSPTSVAPGGKSTGTVTLSGPAPAEGFVVKLTDPKGYFKFSPASLTIPATKSSATFTVEALATTADRLNSEVVATSAAGTKVTGLLSVVAPLSIASFIDPNFWSGMNTTGKVVLNKEVTKDTVVTLTSSDAKALEIPASVTIKAASKSADFAITPAIVGKLTKVKVSAKLLTVTTTNDVTVSPATISFISYNAVAVNPGDLVRGNIELLGKSAGATYSIKEKSGLFKEFTVTSKLGSRLVKFDCQLPAELPVDLKTFEAIVTGPDGQVKSWSLPVNDVAPRPLSLTVPATVTGKGATFDIKVVLNKMATSDQKVSFTLDQTDMVGIPATATVPKGSTSVTVKGTVLAGVKAKKTVTISATVNGYRISKSTVVDRP